MNELQHHYAQSSAPLVLLLDARRNTAKVRLQYGYDSEEFTLPLPPVLSKLGIGFLREAGGEFLYGAKTPIRAPLILVEFKECEGAWGLSAYVEPRAFTVYEEMPSFYVQTEATDTYNALGDAIREALRVKANALKRLVYHMKKADPIPDVEDCA
jgi:hypothetical protein